MKQRYSLSLSKICDYVVVLVVILLLGIGIAVYDDYGVSVDEPNQIIAGHILFCTFFPEYSRQFDFSSQLPAIGDYENRFYGQIATFPTVLLEALTGFRLDNSRIYQVRHLWNFITFFFAVLTFIWFLRKRFANSFLALIGVLMLLLLPRVFAESFYNDRDILFLSWYLITISVSYYYLESPTIKKAFLLGITMAITANTRILGLVLFIPMFFVLFTKVRNQKDLFQTLLVVLIFACFSVLFLPALWGDPLNILIEAIRNLLSRRGGDFDGGIYAFYLGKYIPETQLPWHYLPVWIFITTPVLYSALGLLGSIQFFRNILLDRSMGISRIFEVSLFSILFLSLTCIMLIRPTLYNGWRHFYYLYIPIIYFSLYGIDSLLKKENQTIMISLVILLCISFVKTGLWMVVNHPYEMVYFNPIIEGRAAYLFEKDYWELSRKDCYEIILDSEQKHYVSLLTMGFPQLDMLTAQERERFIVVDGFDYARYEGDYLLANLNKIIGNEIRFPFYQPVSHLFAGKVKIATVFQRDRNNEVLATNVADDLSLLKNQAEKTIIYEIPLRDCFDLSGITLYVESFIPMVSQSLKIFTSHDGVDWTQNEITGHFNFDYQFLASDVKKIKLEINDMDGFSLSLNQIVLHGAPSED